MYAYGSSESEVESPVGTLFDGLRVGEGEGGDEEGGGLGLGSRLAIGGAVAGESGAEVCSGDGGDEGGSDSGRSFEGVTFRRPFVVFFLGATVAAQPLTVGITASRDRRPLTVMVGR
jgi:hypothetical protein